MMKKNEPKWLLWTKLIGSVCIGCIALLRLYQGLVTGCFDIGRVGVRECFSNDRLSYLSTLFMVVVGGGVVVRLGYDAYKKLQKNKKNDSD